MHQHSNWTRRRGQVTVNTVLGTANDRASGMPMGYELWQARDRVGKIAVERFALGPSVRCMMRAGVPGTITLGDGGIDCPERACGAFAVGVDRQGQTVSASGRSDVRDRVAGS